MSDIKKAVFIYPVGDAPNLEIMLQIRFRITPETEDKPEEEHLYYVVDGEVQIRGTLNGDFPQDRDGVLKQLKTLKEYNTGKLNDPAESEEAAWKLALYNRFC